MYVKVQETQSINSPAAYYSHTEHFFPREWKIVAETSLTTVVDKQRAHKNVSW